MEWDKFTGKHKYLMHMEYTLFGGYNTWVISVYGIYNGHILSEYTLCGYDEYILREIKKHCVILHCADILCSDVVVGTGLLPEYQALCVYAACDGNMECVSGYEQAEGSHPAGRGHGRKQLDLHLFPEPPDPWAHRPHCFRFFLKFFLKCNQNCLKNAGNPRDMRRFQVGLGSPPCKLPFPASGSCGEAVALPPCRKPPGQIPAQPCASGPGACWGWGSSISTYAGCQGRLH